LRLLDDQDHPFMGIGLVWLLERIQQLGSIQKAAQDMGMSYPKAIRILKELEGGLGQPVVMRHKGGQERGGAELTAFGAEFLRRYVAWQARVKEYGEAEFHRELSFIGGRSS